jgi:16S rRNA (guanine966-N2)-methyltransferase
VRIIAGEWGGRSIRVPRDARVRPTADRAREAWMSIVQPSLPGARVIDLFAGSGALGLEALSRGAAHADFVEITPASLQALRTNIEELEAQSRVTVHRADALRFAAKLEPNAYDVAFADPPYNLGMAQRLTSLWLRSPFAAILGVEHDTHEELPEKGDTRVYGSTAITLFRA